MPAAAASAPPDSASERTPARATATPGSLCPGPSFPAKGDPVPEEYRNQAQAFLDFYIQGSTAAGVEAQFPGAFEPGMKLRRPALRGTGPEYEDAPLAEGTFAPGEGPEPSDEPYLFVDQCALQLAEVSAAGDTLSVCFVFVNRYPPGRFPGREELDVTVKLPYSMGAASSNMAECVDRLAAYLGTSSEFQPVLMPVPVLLELNDFEDAVASGRL
jgi:hypothetical protein